MNRLEFIKTMGISLWGFIVGGGVWIKPELVAMPKVTMKAPPIYVLGYVITEEMLSDDLYDEN